MFARNFKRCWVTLLALLFVTAGSLPAVASHTGQEENADGSFSLDAAGEVTAQLIFSKGAFRNLAVVLEPTDGTWSGLPSCDVGGDSVDNCFFDTGQCIEECHLNQGRPAPAPTEEIDCTCLYNTRRVLGSFAAGTTFRANLVVDIRSNGEGIDHVWSYDPSQNSDGFDHLRTFHIAPDATGGLWRLEWEDIEGGGDQDFNDVVLMLTVTPAELPAGAVFIPSNSVGGCSGGSSLGPPPNIYYFSHVTVDPLSVSDRRVRLTLPLFNTESTAADVAVCPMLNFEERSDNGGFVTRSEVDHVPFSYNSGNGNPDCTGTFEHEPSVRFSREFVPFPACQDDAFPSNTPSGDIVTVPAAVGTSPGILGLSFEVRLADIDAGITNANELLSDLPGDVIKAEIEAAGTHALYTDILFNFRPGINNLVCPNGVNTWFDAIPSCDVAEARYVWNTVSTVSVASPVTVSLPLHSTEGHTFTSDQEVMLDIVWYDNLAAPLTGHISSDPPARTPFTMTPADGHGLVGQLHLDFPDDLPEGFFGTAYTVLTHLGTSDVIIANAVNFGKDHQPPTLLSAKTARRPDHSIVVTVSVEDPVAGVGDVLLSPFLGSDAQEPALMGWTSGDFLRPTMLGQTLGPFDSRGMVSVDARVRDEFDNAFDLSLPIAHAGQNAAVECTSPDGAAVMLDGTLSTGADPIVHAWSYAGGTASGPRPTVDLPLGISAIDLSVEDPISLSGTDQVVFDVVDTTPPELSVEVSPMTLWPPNHKLREITVSLSATDVCDDAPTIRLVSVVSDQPDNGTGDGNTVEDIQGADLGTADTSLEVRAERGQGARTYTLTYEAEDGSGNVTSVSKTVTVPKSKGRKGGR